MKGKRKKKIEERNQRRRKRWVKRRMGGEDEVSAEGRKRTEVREKE